jgi:HicB family
MPESLHAQLARAADREGVSLNQFITVALAAVVERGGTRIRPRLRKARGERRGRLLAVLLALNLLIVGAAGTVAILLLISAWRGGG